MYKTLFYKSNFIRIVNLKFGQKLRMQSLLFLIKFYYFKTSNSTVSSVEIFQMLRSIEFPLRFIPLDDHKLGIFAIF